MVHGAGGARRTKACQLLHACVDGRRLNKTYPPAASAAATTSVFTCREAASGLSASRLGVVHCARMSSSASQLTPPRRRRRCCTLTDDIGRGSFPTSTANDRQPLSRRSLDTVASSTVSRKPSSGPPPPPPPSHQRSVSLVVSLSPEAVCELVGRRAVRAGEGGGCNSAVSISDRSGRATDWLMAGDPVDRESAGRSVGGRGPAVG